MPLKMEKNGKGEIAQVVKNLPCKHDDLGSIPRAQIKKARHSSMHLQCQCWGVRDRRISRACWLVSLSYSVRSKPMKDPA